LALIEGFGKKTEKLFRDVYSKDLLQTEPKWRSGWKFFDEAVPLMDSGVCILTAPENCGKSNWTLNLTKGILKNTPKSIAVDFVIDDSDETRVRQIVSSTAALSMKDVTLPNLSEDTTNLERRKSAYQKLLTDFTGRYEIIEASDKVGKYKANSLEGVSHYLRDLRETFTDNPIWVRADVM
jgi:hypothetical protein